MTSHIRAVILARPTAARSVHAAVLALAILVAACSQPATVEEGKQVSLLYEAKTIEGELVDVNPDNGPLVFVVGAGMLQPKVEAKLMGMRSGEEKTFHVEDAYGAYDEKRTGTLARDAVPEDTKVGDEINMTSGLTSKIKEIRDSHVVLDLNHPLAGKEIVFKVKVVEVKDPDAPGPAS